MSRLVKRPDPDEILRFCAEDPVERVFLEDVARRGLGRFTAVARNRRYVALCHAGANVVPSGEGTGAFAEVAERARPRMIVGEERAVSELWDAARRKLPPPLDDRPGQPVYATGAAPPPGGSGLRAATLADLPALVPACAAAYLEEVGIDAHARDPGLSEWRTRAQIESGRSWIWLDGGRIRFKAEASAWTSRAVQLQQVWVEPELRGRGYGKQAMADLIRLLLDTTPVVCLFVRPENERAIRLYEAVGMQQVGSYRSLIFD
jgi:hypothetical protein